MLSAKVHIELETGGDAPSTHLKVETYGRGWPPNMFSACASPLAPRKITAAPTVKLPTYTYKSNVGGSARDSSA